MKAFPLAALFAGVCAASLAAPLIRLCDAPPLAIAAWRLTLAALILSPIALPTGCREVRSWSRREGWGVALSGLLLALHFALWITSLQHTSVASSVLLVTTTPIFVGGATWVFLGERPSAWTFVGIIASVAGAAVIARGDHQAGGDSAYGDLLALGGAMAMAGHLLVGRKLRQRMPALPYVACVNLTAAAILCAGCLATSSPLFGHSSQTYLFLLLLALFPQLLGHATFNWSLGRLSPSLVSVTLLAEPILATFIAFVALSEPIPASAWSGGPLVLAGILLAVRGERGPSPA